ncbi:11925_t:CDS:2 [Funneliformis geosporum]|nr:11925_t:CDS:2 [Funneliformis geosporum]
MSKDSYIDWLKDAIDNEHIKLFEYSDFKYQKLIGVGSYGNVYHVNWKHKGFFALKSFKNHQEIVKEIVREYRMHRKVSFHENIIQLYGITMEEPNVYSLVLEYADSDTLKAYLIKHSSELNWDDKFRLALQLSSAVECLHDENIIHRDLHAQNILVHQKKIKLADFGLSRKITEDSSSESKIFGVIPYVDPKCLNDKSCKKDKKSDVYSVGVLMWQISSGRSPFYYDNYDGGLIINIIRGQREEIIPGTPIKYSNLYEECWKNEPNVRPNIREVVLTLETIISHKQSNTLIREIDEKSKNKLSNNVTINYDSKLDCLDIGSIDNLNQKSVQLNSFIEDLIICIIKKHDEGILLDRINQYVIQQILEANQNTNNLIEWLTKNQNKSQYIWLFALFYYNNIDVNENHKKAFELFSIAKDDCLIAQVYFAKCYYDGYGTEKNYNLAFNYYQKSAKNESIIGQYYLANCYQFGIGIRKNNKKAYKWYLESANKGNSESQNCLGYHYQFGIGIKKDRKKAFEWYLKSAENGSAKGQNNLGYCYLNNIGIENDDKQAFEWYFKSAKNENAEGQYNLGYCYRFGIGVEKDEIKANEWYINSGTKKIYRFGDSYQFGIGNKDDDQKEYKWYIENTKDQYKVLFANLFISLKKKLSNSKHEDIITIIDDLSQNLHIGDNVSDVNQISSETRLAVSVTETDSKIISTDNNGGKHIKSILEEDSLFTSVIGTTEIEPFAVFLPLITEVTQVFNEIIKIYQTAEHNKKICGIFLDRVQIADTAVRNLKNRRDENVEFFTTNNLLHLQELVNVISKICKFVGEISQLTSLSKYIQAKNIENSVKELSSEFDSTIIAIQFSLSVDFSINSYKTAKEHEAILSDIKELSQYLTHIGSGITDENQNVSEEVVLLSALNKIMTEAKSADTGIFISELLDYYDFKEEKLEDYRSQTKVKKFKRKNSFNDFVALKLVADKNSSKGDKDNFKKHVTILKKLKPCDCIIQYFGLTSYDDKLYLVTGWAEYGNLREYYRNYKLDIKLKLRFALDIAKGLNFLNAVKVVHRDIRAENILITDRESARIANFRDSRAITDSTKNQGATLESVRYCAPEKLDKGPRYKYDTKCEVYSFGILLWEIGEGKIPYQKVGNDIIAITELVCIKKYREPFSLVSQLPEEYQELAKKAVHPDHNFRPQFSKIFTILQDLHQKVDILHPSPKRAPESEKTISKDKSSIINSAAFNYMSVDEAVKNKSDRELSYKCFEAYAKLNDKKAKYYKAYFIQQNYVKLDVEQTTKDKLIADLYKESADLGYPEAQLRYGYCLFKGNGAEKDLKKAAEYFTKSAENGQAVGMFNAATLYLSDDADIRDEVLGKKYMRLAVYKQHKEAAEYCKKHNIPL